MECYFYSLIFILLFYKEIINVFVFSPYLQACRGDKLDHGQNIPVTKRRLTPGIRRLGDGLDGGGDGSVADHEDGAEDQRDTVTCDTPTSSSVDPPQFHRLVIT